MTPRLAISLLTLGGLLAALPALAQGTGQIGGATGAISRPGWSAGQAPSSDFNRQGAPVSRNEMVRRRAAAAARAQVSAQPRRPRAAARH
ncbi:MAG TPA: hypothetical protein VIL69_04945 [Roseomonas sp.]